MGQNFPVNEKWLEEIHSELFETQKKNSPHKIQRLYSYTNIFRYIHQIIMKYNFKDYDRLYQTSQENNLRKPIRLKKLFKQN